MIKEILAIVGILALTAASVFTIVQYEVAQGPQVIRIDCSLAEFHPDFSPAQRAACRDVRMQHTKETK